MAEAYAEASRKDLREFFKCRAEEIASGGVLCFYCAGRKDRAHPENQLFEESIHFLPYIEKAWQELVNEVIHPLLNLPNTLENNITVIKLLTLECFAECRES